MKKIILNGFLVAGGLLLTTQLRAEAAAEATNPDYVANLLEYTLLGTGAVVILLALGALLRMSFMLMELQRMRMLEDLGIEAMREADLLPKEDFWTRMYKKWTDAVPVDQEGDVMLDHNYDGIRELDNSLPPWWVAMFYITIVIGVAYFGYYHVMDYGDSAREAYDKEMIIAEKEREIYLEKAANMVNETTVEALLDTESLAAGEAIYKGNCAACHGQLGEGGVGPNLTDKYWLHGHDIKGIFKTVKYGVPDKGMIAWKAQLRPADIHVVSSYILTLKGTNPPNGKAPQGEMVAEDASPKANPDQLGMKE